ncbi:hypothetical protein [Burkholderia lata]|uniref:hypothetical protein n=1 Tax=Burkholderia lata (strain ATCC 17760 / DSM 23089 / LMG 22485 / NCIMB 9086 / R18194 / 383) TaxID=482957 RepID=UPI001582DD9E
MDGRLRAAQGQGDRAFACRPCCSGAADARPAAIGSALGPLPLPLPCACRSNEAMLQWLSAACWTLLSDDAMRDDV